jgi:hypothetical protein
MSGALHTADGSGIDHSIEDGALPFDACIVVVR